MVIDTGSHVVVTDIKIPFASLVVLLVKWAFAAILALLIVLLVARAFRLVAALAHGHRVATKAAAWPGHEARGLVRGRNVLAHRFS